MKIKKFGRTFTVVQWKDTFIGKVLSLDTETEKILDESLVPKQVVATAYAGDGNAYLITNYHLHQFLKRHITCTFVFHTFAFDKVVTTKECGFLWWNLIEKGQIVDIAILFKAVIIATKGYCPAKSSLDFITSQLLKDILPKDDDVRLTFGQFLKSDRTVDYEALFKSSKHVIYAVLDPIATLLNYQVLMKEVKTLPTSTLLAHKTHLMGDVALKDMTRRGIAVDLPYVAEMRDKFSIPMEKEAEFLSTYGWVRGDKGILEKYGEICRYLNIEVPITKRGFSMKREDLEPYLHLPFVKSLLNFLDLEHNLAFLNELNKARIHPYYDSLKVTGRTSCKKPNMQNPPRKGGIRECFIPREGHVFIDSDYSSLEMFTAAYCFKAKGWGTAMYDVLQRGADPHTFVGANIYQVPESDVTKDQRQSSKIANYGFLANMSEPTFVEYASSFGASFTLEDAKRIKLGWRKAYPEVDLFFKEPYKRGGTFISDSGFIRANCSYTEFLNIHFQGKAAEGAKIALYLNYKDSIKQVAFVHDQILSEAEESIAEDVLEQQNKNMINGMKMVCPMNIEVDGDIKERFSK